MTEAEWLACTDPGPMLAFLKGKASERKLRLFAVACCRKVWHLLSSHGRAGVEVIERFADNEATPDELAKVHREAKNYGDAVYERSQKLNPRSLENDLAYRDSQQAWLVSCAAASSDDFPGMVVIYSSQCACREMAGYVPTQDDTAFADWYRLVDADKRIQASLLREIIGPRLPPVAMPPSWLAWHDGTVVKLAEAIYHEQAFERLPILGDALEEAGCTNHDMLDHCRGAGPHLRGCWLVDAILGKD